jgi:uncharacterized repeat protein (TIGR03803 family)
MTKFRLLIFTFTSVVVASVLAGCGSGASATIPDSIGRQGFQQLGGGTFRTIYQFNGHRAVSPNGQFIAIGGVLYGTTAFGGHRGRGAIITLTTSGEKHVLYEFKGRSDGIEPLGGLVAAGGVLYGTTVAGGIHCPGESEFTGCGTVFAVTLSGQEHVIYRFKGGSDGVAPSGGLTWLDGKLYGATDRGGFTRECPQIAYGQGCGTLFSVDTSGHERVLYRFHGNYDGARPHAPLLALDGKLYGTTDSGGEGGSSCDYYCGTLFAVTTSGHEKVLHRFAGGSDGSSPSPGLIDIGGELYGTTGYRGASGGCCGTVFKATTSGTESAIYNFKGPPDASAPNGMLVTDHGLLYGTASGGENCFYSESGTIFAVSTAGAERVDHTFSCKSANAPTPGLLRLDRTLYGATDNVYGTVFAFTP